MEITTGSIKAMSRANTFHRPRQRRRVAYPWFLPKGGSRFDRKSSFPSKSQRVGTRLYSYMDGETMRVSPKRLVSAVVIVLVGIGTAASDTSGPTQAPLSINITAADDTVAAGSEVGIEVALTNNSDKTIILMVTGVSPFMVEVRGSDGNRSPETEQGKKLREIQELKGNIITTARVAIPLKAGETIKNKIVVSDLYDMTRPDQYSIQVSRMQREQELKSNVVKVTVTP